jgi:hypothetical protein
MPNTCPVCGFDELGQEPYPYNDIPSHDICSCCHFHFGKTDDDEGYTHEQWREKWIKDGMKFWWEADKPANWNPKRQLLNIGVKI